MQRILILGTGHAQLDAVRYLKDAGHRVFGVSYRNEGPCLPYLDGFEQIDIRDEESIFEYARRGAMDLVYSVGSDLAMPTASAVSERLGLPAPVSARTAQLCFDKGLFRQRLGEDFAGNVRSRVLERPDDVAGWDIWPCVVKPVDNQGQRGVRTVRDAAAFPQMYREALAQSQSGKVICEEYVRGPEISVHCFLLDGEIAYYRPSDRIVFGGLPGGIIHRHALPSATLKRSDEAGVRAVVEETLRRLDVRQGPAYFQIKLSDSGPKVIELAPRLDGCHMWRLILESESVDLLDMTFHLLLGRPVAMPEQRDPRPCELTFFCQPPGTAMDRGQFDANGAVFLYWYYEDGETVRPLNGFMEKAGYCIRRMDSADSGGEARG